MAWAGRPQLKILLVGNAGVGKSCLMNRFVHNRFSSRYRATLGADYFTQVLELEGQTVAVQLWDTAGTERFRSLGMALYRGAHCCVLVFDVMAAASFQAVAAWQAEFLLLADPPDPKRFPFVLLGNKINLPGRQVSPQEAKEWCARTQAQYFETSAKDETGVALAFRSAVKAALWQQGQWARERRWRGAAPLGSAWPEDLRVLSSEGPWWPPPRASAPWLPAHKSSSPGQLLLAVLTGTNFGYIPVPLLHLMCKRDLDETGLTVWGGFLMGPSSAKEDPGKLMGVTPVAQWAWA